MPYDSMYQYYSHISGDRKEPVPDHLENTAEYASVYANEIGCPKLGYILGYNHDPGKFTDDFQCILKHMKTRVNHALPGASILINEFRDLFENDPYGEQVSFGLISGHHSGLTWDFRPGKLKEIRKVAERVKTDFDFRTPDGKTNALSSDEEYQDSMAFSDSSVSPCIGE